MSLMEPSNPTALGPEKYNVAEAQDKDLKLALMNMVKDLKSQISPVKKFMKTQTVEGNERNSLRFESGSRINKENPNCRNFGNKKFRN